MTSGRRKNRAASVSNFNRARHHWLNLVFTWRASYAVSLIFGTDHCQGFRLSAGPFKRAARIARARIANG
jgi:hypothetical protein